MLKYLASLERVRRARSYNEAPAKATALVAPTTPDTDLVSLLVLSAAALIAVAVSTLFLSISHSFVPQVLKILPDTSDFLSFGPSDKEAFLSRLNVQQKRRVASQVHYVSNIISSMSFENEEALDLAYSIVSESHKANLDPLFVAAVIKYESTFNTDARSGAGAVGLMQLMPATAKYVSTRQSINWRGSSKLHDPQYNLQLGIAYLKELQEKFEGNRELALVAYNWGPTNVDNALKQRKRLPAESVRYARNVIGDHKRWHTDYMTHRPEFQYLDISAVS